MKSCRATCCIALRRSTLSFLLLLILSLSATAQEDVLRPRIPSSLFKPITIGLEGGVNFNLFSQTIEQVPVIPGWWLRTFESGSGFSPYAALMIDLPLTPSIALQVKGTYDAKTFGNTETVQWDCPTSGGTVQSDVEVDYSVDVNYIGVGAALRVNVTPEIFATIGPVAHFRLEHATLDRTLTVLSPEECEWLNEAGQQIGKVLSATLTDSSYTSTRIGIEAGVGYKIALTPSVSLVPQVRFQYMFSKVLDDTSKPVADLSGQTPTVSIYTARDAALHSLQLDLALWFQI